MNKILITGGLGFQGRHLALRLSKNGYQVTILTSRPEGKFNKNDILQNPCLEYISVVVGDILDNHLMERLIEANDVVFHLAGKVNPRESIEYPEEYIKINVLGTVSVLEAVRKHNKKLFFVSSCAVYGDGSSLGPSQAFTEESPLLPIDPYAASKVSADRICYSYHKSYNLDITIMRPFTTYGPGQRAGAFGGLIPNLVDRASRKENIVVFGDGSAVRDFLFIEDLIDAYVLLLQSNKTSGEVFNIASSVEVAVIDVVSYIAKRFEVDIEYKMANPREVKRYAADISKIKNLGFVPKVKIQDGIERYISSLNLL